MASSSIIGGGRYNNILTTNGLRTDTNPNQNLSKYAVIAGGYDNTTFSEGSAIGGGGANRIHASSHWSVISGGSANLIDWACGYSAISGGSGNIIEKGAAWAAINGGQENRISWTLTDTNNEATPHYGWIGGGFWNVIARDGLFGAIGGGARNEINGYVSTVGGGADNRIDGAYGFIAGGTANCMMTNSTHGVIGGGFSNAVQTSAAYSTVAGGVLNLIRTNTHFSSIGGGYLNTLGNNSDLWGATIPGGQENVADASYATAAGFRAKASRYGQNAHASGYFAAVGDAQTSVHVVRRSTSNGTATEMFLDGDGATARMSIPSGSTWTFWVQVTGRSSTGKYAGYRIEGVIENDGGATTIYGATTTVLAEEESSWNAEALADDGNNALIIKVTGQSSTNIRWVATVRTTEVSY